MLANLLRSQRNKKALQRTSRKTSSTPPDSFIKRLYCKDEVSHARIEEMSITPTMRCFRRLAKSFRTFERSLSSLSASQPLFFAMKPGTPIPGLDFLKNVEQPVSKPREEYPAWVDNLTKSKKSLAVLRKMDVEDATDKEKMRYLKLTRRREIKQHNAEGGI